MLTRYKERHLTWIDLISPTPQEVRSLMQEFDLDPLFAEELLVPSYKPRAERRGEHLYVVLHFPVLRGFHQRPEQEIDFVIGKNFLITARYGTTDRLHAFAKAFEVHAVLGSPALGHGGHLFAAMARNLYHALRSECDVINRRLEHIEERTFNGDERQMVIEISQTARIIHDFRQALVPHTETLQMLEPLSSRLFGQDFAFYVREIMGDEARVRNALEHVRESLHELRETNNSLLSTKQNEIMKTLTVIAFITLPLELVAGIFTIPARSTPILGAPGDFWIILGLMTMLALGFLVYFVRKGWL
jgi:magnesium transporter